MSVNDYMEIAQRVGGNTPATAPVADRSEQVNVGLEFAKRQAEKQVPEAPKIPPMGTTPLAN